MLLFGMVFMHFHCCINEIDGNSDIATKRRQQKGLNTCDYYFGIVVVFCYCCCCCYKEAALLFSVLFFFHHTEE